MSQKYNPNEKFDVQVTRAELELVTLKFNCDTTSKVERDLRNRFVTMLRGSIK